MQQTDAFQAGEADAWYRRNRDVLHPAYVDALSDPVLALMECRNAWPTAASTILDVGAANGYRLEKIRQYTQARCTGIDPSVEAVKAGHKMFPGVLLEVGTAAHLRYDDGAFSHIIVHYVLHWVDRASLLCSVAEMDRVLQDGGYLILGDFAPDAPTKVPYKHKEGLWTWKQDYPALFLATSLYSLVAYETYNHDTHKDGWAPSGERGMVALLRKGEVYAV